MNWFSYKISMYKLNSLRQKEKEKHLRKLEEARRSGDRDEIERVKYEGYFQLKILDEEISVLITERLISKANKFFVEIPDKPIPGPGELYPENENWKMSETSEWYLTNKGISEVRNQNWQVEKNRREKTAFWISFIIGLIGAITGLIAVIKS